jgi:hypothetical protein
MYVGMHTLIATQSAVTCQTFHVRFSGGVGARSSFQRSEL